jgi:hypothetical protein
MDARYLTQPQREAFKRLLCARRDEIDQCIKRMQSRNWYTHDAVLLNLQAAYTTLHSAVQLICQLDGTPVKVRETGTRYPL